MAQDTTTDRILEYPEQPWHDLGYVFPNFGDKETSQNPDILGLVSDIGFRTQQIASTPCALLLSPPKVDTLFAIQGLFDQLRVQLSSLTLQDNQRNIKTDNVTPTREDFRIFPTPYRFIYNRWIKDWVNLSLNGLSMMMQAEDNLQPHKWGLMFAEKVGAIYREMEERIALQLLRLDAATVRVKEWKLTEQLIEDNYKPNTWWVGTDGATPRPDELLTPTEDTRKVLVRGIFASMIPRVDTSKPSDGSAKAAGSSGDALARA